MSTRSRQRTAASASAAAAPGAPWPMRRLWPVLFVVVVLAYLPALSGGFIWDDSGHVTRPDLRSVSGLLRIWTEMGATQQYYPVVHTAFWIEHGLWGDSTLGYHLLNVLLHATSAGLVVVILRRLAVPGAALAGLLFALHPVAVESVAWVSEQKNTLSAVFYLLAALAYLRFDARREGQRSAAIGDYAAASVLFLLALFTKSVTATQPAALLVVIWWKRGRIGGRRDVIPLLPWFAAGAAAGLLTAWVERHFIGAEGTDFTLGGVARCLLAGRVLWFYAGKVLWPADLIFIYPHWTITPAAASAWLYPLAWFGLLGGLAWRRQRGLLAGALFFSGSLFPALGFVNVFPFLYSYVADHFQYLACLGLIVPVAGGGALLASRLSPALARGLAGGVLLVLGVLTFRQCGMYHDLFSLYGTTIERNPGAWMAQNNLGTALVEAGRVADAVAYFQEAIRLRGDYPEGENNLGDAYNRLNRPADAIPHLQRAVQLKPLYPEAHNNLGAALMRTGHPAEGIAEFEQALRLKPDYPVAEFNLGLALGSGGQPAAALPHFEAAVRLQPDYADAELYWGIALTLLARVPEAVPHYERAVRLEPDAAPAHAAFARALAAAGRLDAAIREYQEAVRCDPASADHQLNLALALRQAGRMPEATEHYNEALRLHSLAPAGP